MDKRLHKIGKPGVFISALIWNMSGICFYYLCRWLINISVVRMSTDFLDAGILALAVSITGIWNVVALFSVRNIQVSDIKNEYSDNEYISARIITVAAAILLCAGHALLFAGSINQALVITVYMILAASVSFADVMHGILQKQWRMDLIGISYVLRGIALIVPFVLLYHYLGLLPAVIGMAFFSIIIVFAFDIRFARKYTDIKIRFVWRRILSLIKICLPLVIVTALSTLIPSVTRMALEKLTDTETLGVYGSVTLPANIIQMVVMSAFAPFANVFTRCFQEQNKKKYLTTFWAGTTGIIIFFALFFVLTIPFGDWLMRLLFGAGMEKYTYLFREATFICFLASLSWFIGIPMTVFRRTKIIMIIYTGGVAVCSFILRFMITRYGTSGANYIQIAAYAIIAVAMLVTVQIIAKRAFTNKLIET